MENYMNEIDAEKPADILNELFLINSRRPKKKPKPKFFTQLQKTEINKMEPRDRLDFLWRE